MSQATAGRAMAAASISERDSPSRCEARTKRSIAAYRAGMSSRPCRTTQRSATPWARASSTGVDGVGLLRLEEPDHQKAHVLPLAGDAAGHLEELLVTLLPHQTARGADNQVVLLPAQLLPSAGAGPGIGGRIEVRLVDAVAHEVESVGGLEAVGPRVLQVLLDLEEQVMAPARRPALGRHGLGPTQPAGAVVEEEAVDGVQHMGGAGHAGHRRPQEAPLGVVAVHDVVAAAAHGEEELGGAAGVGRRRDLALEGLVVDPHPEAG